MEEVQCRESEHSGLHREEKDSQVIETAATGCSDSNRL